MKENLLLFLIVCLAAVLVLASGCGVQGKKVSSGSQGAGQSQNGTGNEVNGSGSRNGSTTGTSQSNSTSSGENGNQGAAATVGDLPRLLSGVRVYADGGWALAGDLYHSSDGGQTWIKVTPPSLGKATPQVLTSSSDTAWIFGQDASGNMVVFRTTSGGANWTQVPSGQAAIKNRQPHDVAFANASTILVNAWKPDPELGGSYPAGLYQTVNNGQTWNQLNPRFDINNAAGPQWLVFTSGGRGFTQAGIQAASEPGVTKPGSERLFMSTDGGSSWKQVDLKMDTSVPHSIFPVEFDARGQHGSLVVMKRYSDSSKDRVNLYLTSDGGSTWTRARTLAAGNKQGTVAWSVDDGGQGWIYTMGRLYHLHGGTVDTLSGPVNLVSFEVASDQSLWALQNAGNTQSNILHSTDGGQHWTTVKKIQRPSK